MRRKIGQYALVQAKLEDRFSMPVPGDEVARGWMALWAAAAQGQAQQALGGLAGEFTGGNAQRLAQLQREYLEKQSALWMRALSGEPGDEAGERDRRFASEQWRANPYYRYLMQSYRLAADFCTELAEAAPLEGQAKQRVRFATRQWVDALCPVNFAATNPEALKRALDTRGESLTRGIANLIADSAKGRISQSEEAVFEVGRELAATPGSVVYENELIQLIQYRPLTAQVAKRPLVVIPPCINKFYILDLQPENSFVRHALGEGNAVFMLSWRNPGAAEGHFTWDDYVRIGVMQALAVAREVSGADRVNALGFCVGGTLLGATLARLAASGETGTLPASATYLASMHDFSDTGQISLFVDPESVAAREATLGQGGLLPAAELASVFSALRANELVWPYVVNNYLLGEQPTAFDLLHWNCDGTNLPGPMFCYYLRNMYLENKLCIPGALASDGVPLDLGKVTVPAFFLATREDHIVPWRTAYRSLAAFSGEKTFVLGASGHVAGIVNPPSKGRRSYWTGESSQGSRYPADPEAWLQQAQEHRGSWWGLWSNWLARHSGGQRKAPARLGNRKYKPIEPAPGRYVRQKATGDTGIQAKASHDRPHSAGRRR